jgi:filamentous hemagglutinin family protein
MLISNNPIIFIASLFLLLNTSLYAQIKTDGSLGQPTPLNGPNFQINSDLGKQMEGNLFHSFEAFNLKSGETATFTGPANVTNILARVTGGQRSFIDGTLRSNILHANLWLLNPSGILFGKNASLDISGSFYASTASDIKLKDGSFFHAQPDPNADHLLTSAPPDAFGLLGNSLASIEIHGNTIKNSNFSAPNGKINITTDNDALTITNSTLDVSGDKGAGQISIRASQLLAVNAKIYANNYAENPEVGEVGNGLINISTLGNLSLTDNTSIDVSSEKGAGQIVISAENFFANNAQLMAGANSGPSEDGLGSINIFTSGAIGLRNTNINASGQRNGAAAGQVILSSKQLFANNSKIVADNWGDKNGLVKITTQEKMSLTNGSVISANNQGVVGDTQEESGIVLKAGNSLFIGLTPEELCVVTNCDIPLSYEGWSALTDNFSRISSINAGSGIGGNIQISTPVLNLSYGMVETLIRSTGSGGEIRINARNILQDYGLIRSLVTAGGSGHAGNISIHGDGIDSLADRISLSNYSHISSSVAGDAAGGNAGKVDLRTHQLLLDGDGSEINGFSYGSSDAGSIQITADMISLSNKGRIITEAMSANGGKIDITVYDSLRLFSGSRIITTAYSGGTGGDLTITGPRFVILDKSHLTASANRGKGGNITITANYLIGNIWLNPGLDFFGGKVETQEQFKGIIKQQDDFIQQKFTSPGYSVIDATSRESVNGNLMFNARRWEFPNFKPLDRRFWRDELSRNRCAFSKDSRFIITARDILPRCPEDLRTQTIRLGR